MIPEKTVSSVMDVAVTNQLSTVNTHTGSNIEKSSSEKRFEIPYLKQSEKTETEMSSEGSAVKSKIDLDRDFQHIGKEEKMDDTQPRVQFTKMKIYGVSDESYDYGLQNVQRNNEESTFTSHGNSLNECDIKHVTCVTSMPIHIKLLPKTQSLDLAEGDRVSNNSEYTLSQSSSSELEQQGAIPKLQCSDQTRPIYPSLNYSPFSSPRIGRRRAPLRESRRVSIENNGSFILLNQYKLTDEIGQGSYGLVKLAYSEEDSTHYAMKILSKKKLLKKAGLLGRLPKKNVHIASPLERVYREIAVLKKLDHPNVVKLIEVLDDPIEDSLYLVFELVKHGEILSIPTKNPLPEDRAWSVFRDALQGVEYLHYQKIIHADLKPANLLLTENGRVKVADLGVCNEFIGDDASLNNGSSTGTPAFRAPETLTSDNKFGKAIDIWALGVTLYALVYGTVPFNGPSVPAVYEKIKKESLLFPHVPEISLGLKNLIRDMLVKDPQDRIKLPRIKEHPWITSDGKYCLPSEDDNCRLIQVSDEDLNNAVSSIPKLDTLILIKTMLKKHSFQNPFNRGISGKAPQRGGSKLERFVRSGRSNSAPGAYNVSERNLQNESSLPSVTEGDTSTNTIESSGT